MHELPHSVERIALYLRRSREDLEAEKRGEDTLQAQRDLMTNHVLPRFHCPFDVFSEVESGDTIKDRPVFQRVLQLLGDTYQAIAIKDLSRLGRGNYADMGIVYDMIRDCDIFVITRDSVFNPRNEDHKRAIRMAMFISREEYESIVLRLTNGKNDKVRARGYWVAGSTPFGYDYHRGEHRLLPNADADTVRLIYQLYVEQNYSLHRIAKQLQHLGIKTATGRDRWNPQVIRRLLCNPAYCGDVQYRKTKRQKASGKVTPRPAAEHIWFHDAHPAIVTRDLWQRTQSRLEKTTPKTPHTLTTSELASLVVCSSCGRKMIRQTSTQHYQKRNSSDISLYHKEFLACVACGHYVQYRHVEEQLLVCLRLLPLHRDRLLKSAHQCVETATVHNMEQSVANRLRKDVVKVQRKLENSAIAYLEGTFNEDVYLAVQKRLQSDFATLSQRLTGLEQQHNREANRKSWDANEMVGSLRTVADAYQALSEPSHRNKLLDAVFREIKLEFLGKQGRHNRFALQVSLASDISPDAF